MQIILQADAAKTVAEKVPLYQELSKMINEEYLIRLLSPHSMELGSCRWSGERMWSKDP